MAFQDLKTRKLNKLFLAEFSLSSAIPDVSFRILFQIILNNLCCGRHTWPRAVYQAEVSGSCAGGVEGALHRS